MENCLIFGLGGIGSVYGHFIQNSGKARVSAVARSNYDVAKEKGIVIKSPKGESRIGFDEVYTTGRSRSGNDARQFEYVVVSTKAFPRSTPSLPTLLESFITPKHTTIVLIQNGVGIEDEVAEKWPENSIITCVAWAGATQVESGVIQHNGESAITLGLFENKGVPAEIGQRRLDTFVNLLSLGGGVVDVKENMQTERWKKVVWNCAWNALTTLSNLDTHAYLTSSPSAPVIARAVMREVITVAQGLGLDIPFTHIEVLMDRADGKKITSSMQADCQNQRPMEIEVILGTPLRKAQELGIAVPILETLYALLTAIDKNNSELQAKKSKL